MYFDDRGRIAHHRWARRGWRRTRLAQPGKGSWAHWPSRQSTNGAVFIRSQKFGAP
jgi:hypothetical protein